MGIETKGFLRSVNLISDRIVGFDKYPYTIPAIRSLKTLVLHPQVTFLVGENGSGKSTLIEAIAVAAGFNAEGGSKNLLFATHHTESHLHEAFQLVRGPYRERDGFFLRAESFYNVATQVQKLGVSGYGDKSLHAQSHGESFMALVSKRFRGNGLYILDEPEAALSPSRQLALLKIIEVLVRRKKSQFIIATHSPILMAYPNAMIYHLDRNGISQIAYEDTEHYKVTLSFLSDHATFLYHLFRE